MEDIKKWLKETGLEVVSIHAEPTEEIVKKIAELGGKAVIWAGTPFCNKAEAVEVAHKLDEMAEMAEPYGIKIGYHNHSQEFFMDEGKTLLEHLLDNSTKCYSQLDCGWAQNGGCYPPSFIRRYKNRFIAIHVKENSKVQGPGPRPASRHAAEEAGHANPFANIKEMPLEERQKILDGFNAHMNSPEGKKQFEVQCPMGAPESNMNWQDIKDALDEQDFEAFWGRRARRLLRRARQVHRRRRKVDQREHPLNFIHTKKGLLFGSPFASLMCLRRLLMTAHAFP